MSWLYKQSERPTSAHPYSLYTVGYIDHDGTWVPESDHSDANDAADRVAWLNGSPRISQLLDLADRWREAGFTLCADELTREIAKLAGGGR